MKEPRLYRIVRPILTFLFKLLFHPHIINKENIPLKGRIVLAGNHTNILDCILLMACTKRTVHFLAKDELVKGPLGFIFKHLGIIPVDRKGKNKSALPKAINALNEDKMIGIFPEGTINRTKDQVTIPFKSGAVRMAFNTKSKIIPFSIIGKYHIFGKGITIVFDKPYDIKTNDIDKENQNLQNKISTMIIERRQY